MQDWLPDVNAELRGLNAAEVADRVADGRVNTLPDRSGRSNWEIVRDNVFTRVNAILAVLFGIVALTGQLLQGAFVLLIIANSAIGVIQELRAKRTLDNLALIGEAHPTVLRDGVRTSIPRDQVVVDDLIVLAPGDQIVVDGVVVDDDYLEVDESMLTGEADPIAKVPGDDLLSGAFVVAGAGIYRATKVGADAYAAQLTAQAAKFTLVNSELRAGIDKILRFVSFLLFPVGALTIWVQFNQEGATWQDSALRMVAALVPMIPEGLILITSVAFALGVIRLGQRNCLVQELPAIEGLARVSVVCADKTGTLTQNAMTLGEIIPVQGDEAKVRELLGHMVAADPTPNASMQAIANAVELPAASWAVAARAPFTSAKKWSGVTFTEQGSWVLGAPDVLAKGSIAERAEQIGATGRRVLLLGQAKTSVTAEDAPGEVTPVALLALDQLVRPDAADTLAYFNDQNVAVKVISGDNAASVGAVTRSLGVSVDEAIDARTLPEQGEEFTETINQADVFGRVTPQQKRAMVTALQSRGHTVAMTGDGVNDVLALKDADLGVAMGSGSAATRAVAQIVLLDDRFATLPHVVAEGRRVIGNIERVAKLFLTKTVYAVALALIIGVMGLPNPFLPLQTTVVNWFTIGIPAFLLALPPNRERARPGFVNRVLTLAVPSGIIVGLATTTSYVVVRGFGAVSQTLQLQASTAALVTLLIVAIWVLAVVARPWVTWRLGLVIFAYAFYAACFLLPWSRDLLSLDLSNTGAMALGVGLGLLGAALVEVVWWLTAKYRGEVPRIWRTREHTG